MIGIAPPGGQLPASWHPILIEALESGLDLAAGLHQRLGDIPEIAHSAARLGRQIHDVRHCNTSFPVGTGLPRAGRRLLTVGTDCVVGKKYTALVIAKAMGVRGHGVDFRATGQTGILISGRGIAVDAVVSDFLSGAVEVLSPANTPDHWDVIEGQGSLFHPAYAAVTLGLVHGSQPDAFVLCHDLARNSLASFPNFPVAPWTSYSCLPISGSAYQPKRTLSGRCTQHFFPNGSGSEEILADTAERLNFRVWTLYGPESTQ